MRPFKLTDFACIIHQDLRSAVVDQRWWFNAKDWFEIFLLRWWLGFRRNSTYSPNEPMENSVSLPVIGSKLPVSKGTGQDKMWIQAEVLGIRFADSKTPQYYVHFDLYNKRLDEWVPLDRMDVSKMKMPSPKKTPHPKVGPCCCLWRDFNDWIFIVGFYCPFYYSIAI